ncbi:MAG: pilus assembly protein CpaE, partial [Pseudomonadota bacterium]|nr:pilus assembly protein CpaE [Pseudomonadota bacterium]
MNPAAPRPFDALDDGFDVDMDFSEPSAFPTSDARSAAFLSAGAHPGQPAPSGGGSPQAPSSFNPVGEMVARAQSTLAPAPAATPHSAPALAPMMSAETSLAPVGAIGEVSVPRIAIHVFAERQDTLAAAERAAQDRRLSRATTQIRIG